MCASAKSRHLYLWHLEPIHMPGFSEIDRQISRYACKSLWITSHMNGAKHSGANASTNHSYHIKNHLVDGIRHSNQIHFGGGRVSMHDSSILLWQRCHIWCRNRTHTTRMGKLFKQKQTQMRNNDAFKSNTICMEQTEHSPGNTIVRAQRSQLKGIPFLSRLGHQ